MKDYKKYLQQLSYSFEKGILDEVSAGTDPFVQFEKWFHQAVESGNPCPNAMVLSTATKTGKPGARIMLLRNFGPEGFVFYTNYQSRKAQELEQNQLATLTFFWPHDERQVRIEGTIRQQDPITSDEYFAQRPDGSKTGAWASPQSQKIKNRKEIEDRQAEIQKTFEGQTIPRPAHWGGYVLVPVLFEFWQGRPNRLHDRLVYELHQSGSWNIFRLAP